MDDTSPLSRTLRTLELLQQHPDITAAELARRLGVTDRAVRRYIALLREADVPVDSTPGRHGGYRLGRGVRLPPLSFSADEALSLVMAVLETSAIVSHGDVAEAAVTKILRALPTAVAARASAVKVQAAVAAPDWGRRPDPAITGALAAAVAERRPLRLAYRTASGTHIDYEVDPWAVVVRRNRWYLICRTGDDELRTLRVDRVSAVTEREGHVERPDDLDPAALLEEKLGADWPLHTQVLFHAPLAEVAPMVGRVMGRLEPVDDHSCRLTGTTNNPEMYAAEWLAPLRTDFTVEGGPELIEAVADVARRYAAALPDSGRGAP